MGGGQSKPPTKKVHLAGEVDTLFSANCSTSAQSMQSITLKNVKVIVMDGCDMAMQNKGTTNAECNMDSVMDGMAEAITAADKDVAAQIASQHTAANDALAAGADEYSNTLSVKKELTARCGSEVHASQTIEVLGGTIMCTGPNSKVSMTNNNDVRAVCLKSYVESLPLDAPAAAPAVAPAAAPAPTGNTTLVVAVVLGTAVVGLLLYVALSGDEKQKNVPAYNRRRNA